MTLIVVLMSLCIFSYAEAYYKRSVQDMIDDGTIARCYRDAGILLLANQRLTSLQGIENIPNPELITFIDASNNQITSLRGFSCKKFCRLTQLWLNNNLLEDLAELNDLEGIDLVRELHVNSNRLRILDMEWFKKLQMLYVLNLGFNDIKEIIPLSHGSLNNLEVLFLNNNKLTFLPPSAFFGCFRLKALYIHDNILNRLDSYCFAGLCNLRLLLLYNNMIKVLPAYVFSHLNNLNVLYVNNNAISSLERDWSYGLNSLKQLAFHDNPMQGDICLDTDAGGARYLHIKKLLDCYSRPFTVLEIGSCERYFSLRIASQHDCTCVIIESNEALQWPKFCEVNRKLDNVVILQKQVTPEILRELALCEHFDVVVAFNITYQLKDKWKEMVDAMLTLGDHIFIDTPSSSAEVSANKETLPMIDQYLLQNHHGSVIAQVPRYGNPGLFGSGNFYSNMYHFQMHKNIVYKPTWGSPNIRFYPVNSTFKEKTYYKPRIDKTISWKPGINLWTFKNLNGVYPAQDFIKDEIKRLAAFPHGDFVPWNMVIQGHHIELIDWEDNNLVANMHNADACWMQFIS